MSGAMAQGQMMEKVGFLTFQWFDGEMLEIKAFKLV